MHTCSLQSALMYTRPPQQPHAAILQCEHIEKNTFLEWAWNSSALIDGNTWLQGIGVQAPSHNVAKCEKMTQNTESTISTRVRVPGCLGNVDTCYDKVNVDRRFAELEALVAEVLHLIGTKCSVHG